jgi:hypothetical protein
LAFQLETSGGGLLAPIYHSTEFGAFGGFQQLGRNIGLHSYPGGRIFSQGGLDLTLVLLVLVFILYSAFGGLYLLILSIL